MRGVRVSGERGGRREGHEDEGVGEDESESKEMRVRVRGVSMMVIAATKLLEEIKTGVGE